MACLKIGVIGDFFTRWMGGIAFFGPLIRGLSDCAASADTSVTLFLNASVLRPEVAGNVPVCAVTRACTLHSSGAIAHLLSYLSPEQPVCFYSDLRSALQQLRIDVVAVAGDDLREDLGLPWCGYIPDFQHKYLADLFSQSERMQRDLRFRSIAENASALIVNASAVVNDIERFYPAVARSKPIIRFPVIYPKIDLLPTDDLAVLKQKHQVTSPYLISCSQRWMHKQHSLIVDAFASHLKEHPSSPLTLVFTGNLTDYRDTSYADSVRARIVSHGISNRVRELGMIDTAEQVGLIQGAAALVQASLFEGGAGASGSVLAALLGTPVFSSDIAPNRELTVGKRYYFDPHSHHRLSLLVNKLLEGGEISRSSPLTEAVRTAIVTGGCLQLIEELRSLV